MIKLSSLNNTWPIWFVMSLKMNSRRIEEALNKISGKFTVDTMIELNYLVDVEGQSAKEVAHDFLLSKNMKQE